MASEAPYINVTAKSPATMPQRSPWHSPVPYLFGGLAAMLGLIAFALLILACSYWKLSGYLDGSENNGSGDQRDLESGNAKGDETQKPQPIWEDKIVVIMAGQAKPTFLATPLSSRWSSFGNNNNNNTCVCQNSSENKSLEMSVAETEKEYSRSATNQESSEQNRETRDQSASDQNTTH